MKKASGGDGIPAKLFQILKDVAAKCWTMLANLGNSAVATGLEKVSFHSNPKEGQCQRIQTTLQLHSFHMISKVMLKILQARLEQYMN